MLTLYPGYTAIIGPNGAGKTTLLRKIEDIARTEKYDVFHYNNLFDGGDNALEAALFNGETRFVAQTAFCSEGEKISIHFGRALNKLGKQVQTAIQTDTPLFILLDSLDSGASIDRARDLQMLFDRICRDIKTWPDGSADHAIYLIAAVNHFELAQRDSVDPRTGKHYCFSDYNDYAKFICNYFKEKR